MPKGPVFINDESPKSNVLPMSENVGAKNSKAIKSDLKKQILAAKKSQKATIAHEKDGLVANLEMLSKKFLSASGYLNARATLESVTFSKDVEDESACKLISIKLAKTISKLCAENAAEIKKADVEKMEDSWFDHYINDSFVESDFDEESLALQVLTAQVLEKVYPGLDKLLNFRDGSNHEIEVLEKTLKEFSPK